MAEKPYARWQVLEPGLPEVKFSGLIVPTLDDFKDEVQAVLDEVLKLLKAYNGAWTWWNIKKAVLMFVSDPADHDACEEIINRLYVDALNAAGMTDEKERPARVMERVAGLPKKARFEIVITAQ